MQSIWHLISHSFSPEWCVGTFLIQGNVDTIRSNQFIFPSPLTHLAEKTSPHANSNRGTERGGGEATYNLSKSGTLFFLTKRALPVRIYFYLPYDIYSILLTIVVYAQICLPHYVVSSSGP